MRNHCKSIFTFLLLIFATFLSANTYQDTFPKGQFNGLKFRNLTPAFVSGRIADIAVNPNNHSEYYIAAASGNIWKTTNNGTTFKPIFEKYGAYSIGCLAIDPTNPKIVWAGTGENNHQRSVSYGDGIYKSLDGGTKWKHMGLKKSHHIGMIAIDPRDPNIVYAAAEGSVWGPGGDRGLYKTTDGGKSWNKILTISENTGVNSILIDMDNPDILYATSEQRRRRTQTRIGGGPESAIHKSTDGGVTWRKLTAGLPKVDKGGIGLAQSPAGHQVIYAIVEAAQGKGGFFRSEDKGESWKKMNSYNTSGQYYAEIVCDPKNVDKVYSLETRSKVTLDGGKTWSQVGLNKRHVDDHALWIDPNDTDHFLIAGDGGAYETYDGGKEYIHKTNLPITQFYRVNVDNSEPFYYVYGGTQDNSSLGAPSQTLYADGVTRGEWVITLGGDGFFQAIDPNNPDLVYSEYQYGNLFRHDKKSGEITSIKPRERKDELAYKWNWNTPMIMSHHNPQKLYMAANKVFRTADRGHSWEVISEDITAQIDRNKWPVMGRYWGVDAVAKDVSTSQYGTAVSLAESRIKEGLLAVGTDDGVIQISEDDGQNWRKINRFKGVPEYTYVSDILWSKHNENVLFATFDNRKHNDMNPYILASKDKGNTWQMISGDLPKHGSVHSIEQDHVDPNLLFAGTEFGIFFSSNMGASWIQLKSGIPTISVKDVVIQERENDLVLATFGRGFYILDDYSSLRKMAPSFFQQEAHIFPVKDTRYYLPKNRGGYGFGSMVYKSKNAPFGATFTYFLKDVPKTLQQQRREKEKELIKTKSPIPMPSIEDLRKEKEELPTYLVFTIRNAKGEIIRKLTKKPGKGIQRLNWDLKYISPQPIYTKKSEFNPYEKVGSRTLVPAGDYNITMSMVQDGQEQVLTRPEPFKLVPLNLTTIPAQNKQELADFRKTIIELERTIRGSEAYAQEAQRKIAKMKHAALRASNTPADLMKQITSAEKEISNILWAFTGAKPKASPEEKWPAIPSINDRLSAVAYVNNRSNSDITQTQKDVFNIIKEEFPPILEQLRNLGETKIPAIEQALESLQAPWTPGRLPLWRF